MMRDSHEREMAKWPSKRKGMFNVCTFILP